MENTIVYLIRHAETVDERGIRNTNEDSQMINEKEILSVDGEEQAKKLSENEELTNLDVIWSSSYTRAKATAKYIANINNLNKYEEIYATLNENEKGVLNLDSSSNNGIVFQTFELLKKKEEMQNELSE